VVTLAAVNNNLLAPADVHVYMKQQTPIYRLSFMNLLCLN